MIVEDSWDHRVEHWLSASRIDIRETGEGGLSWRAVAYDSGGEVLECAIGDTRRAAIELVCREIGQLSFWKLEGE